MEQISGEVRHVQSTRRWTRHHVNLPVRIIALNGILTTPVPARGSEISRAGMALYAPVALKPGDLMRLQFPTSKPSGVNAVVRNRAGECLGLEFLSQLPPDDEAMDRSILPDSVLGGSSELRKTVRDSCNPQALFAGLRRKQEELTQVQKEIEALNVAILLLADAQEEVSRLSRPGRLELDTLATTVLTAPTLQLRIAAQ
jgi:PilZ domain-containing protein